MSNRISQPAWRSAASVALILHCFALFVAVASNIGGQASPLGRALRNIGPVVDYLQILGMDLSYEFALATAAPQDAPHRFVLTSSVAPETTLAELPDSSMSLTRRRRFRQLAAYAADFDETFAENADLATRFPVALAEAWIAELKLPPANYKLQCLRTVSARLEQLRQRRSPEALPVSDRVFELQLVWSPNEKRYQAVRRQSDALTSQAK